MEICSSSQKHVAEEKNKAILDKKKLATEERRKAREEKRRKSLEENVPSQRKEGNLWGNGKEMRKKQKKR